MRVATELSELPGAERFSFLGRHMRNVVKDDTEVLPCRRFGIRPAQFFDGFSDLPAYIPQPLFPYTPPGSEARTESFDLAEVVLEDDPRPILVTGRSGSGKTLQTRYLFHRLLVRRETLRGGGDGQREGRALRDHLFVRIDAGRLHGFSSLGGPPPPGSFIVRAVLNAAFPDQSVNDPDRLRCWIRHSPPTIFVFDLNRAFGKYAMLIAKDVIDVTRDRVVDFRQHRFVILYRTQSAHADKVWKQLDPKRGKVRGLETRPLDIERAVAYLDAARRRHWSRKMEDREGEGEREREGEEDGEEEIQRRVGEDLDAFRRLARRHADFIGLPLLMHFTSTLDDIAGIRNLSDLYDRVVREHLERELEDPSNKLGPRGARKVLPFLSAAVALEMAVSGKEQGGDGLSLPLARFGDVQLMEGFAPMSGVPAVWAEHFARSRYRTLRYPARPRFAADPELWQRRLLQHSFLIAAGAEVRALHDSFAYYYSAKAFVYPWTERDDGRPPEPREIILERLGRILAEDPRFWHDRAEFLAGWLAPAEIRRLIGSVLSAGGVELASVELATRLAAGLASDVPADDADASTIRGLVAWIHRRGNWFARFPQMVRTELHNELPQGWPRPLAGFLRKVAGPENLRAQGHHAGVNQVAFSPDGRWVVSGSLDHTVRLWRVGEDGLTPCARAGEGHTDKVRSVAFSPDGRWVVSGSHDHTVRLWRVGEEGLTPCAHAGEAHRSWVGSVAFSPEGRWVVSGSWDTTVRLWRVSAEGLTPCAHAGEAHVDSVNSVAFSPDERWVVTGSWDHTVRLWRVGEDGLTPCARAGEAHTKSIRSVAFSADGRWVVSGSWDTTARLWRVSAEGLTSCAHAGEAHVDSVNSVAFSPDERWVVSGSSDTTVRLWRVSEEGLTPCAHAGEAHVDSVNSVAFSPDERWVVTGSGDHTVRLWRVGEDGLTPCARAGEGHNSVVPSVGFSPDGQWVVSGSDDKTVRVWRVGEDGLTLCGHAGDGRTESDRSVAFSPDGQWAVSGPDDNDKTMRQWRVGEDGLTPCARTGDGHWVKVKCVFFSPDGRWVVSGSHDNTVRLWRVGEDGLTPCARAGEAHVYSVNSVAFSPDGQWVVSGSGDNTVRLWRVGEDGLTSCASAGEVQYAGVMSVAFSRDGRLVVSGCTDGTVRLWRVDYKGLTLGTLAGGGRRFWAGSRSVAFSPDGRWVASESDEDTVRLWRVEENAFTPCTGAGEGHTQMVTSVTFSPDGRWVVSGSWDRTVRLWRVIEDGLTAEAVLWFDLPVAAVSFATDGRLLVATAEPRAFAYDLRP